MKVTLLRQQYGIQMTAERDDFPAYASWQVLSINTGQRHYGMVQSCMGISSNYSFLVRMSNWIYFPIQGSMRSVLQIPDTSIDNDVLRHRTPNSFPHRLSPLSIYPQSNRLQIVRDSKASTKSGF